MLIYTGATERIKKRTRDGDEEKQLERRKEQVIGLARRGLPGKAMQHAISEGLAPDTPETFAKVQRKFVDPPPSQATSRRMPAPAANQIMNIDLVRAFGSFDKGRTC